jgi:integrase/recombinase XerD
VATLTVVNQPNTARRAERSPVAFMTYEELLRVLRVARKRSTRDWCMLLLAYGHGLRTTEVCNLQLEDVTGGVLFVRRLKGSRSTAQPLYSHRAEPLLDEIKALTEWLRMRREDGSPALFTSQKGGPLHRSQFFRIFQSTAREAGLSTDKRHPRVLKYSLASHLLAADADVTAVSEFLGHRSLNSTLQYIKAARRLARRSHDPSLGRHAVVYENSHVSGRAGARSHGIKYL